jgi:hypothetical protein
MRYTQGRSGKFQGVEDGLGRAAARTLSGVHISHKFVTAEILRSGEVSEGQEALSTAGQETGGTDYAAPASSRAIRTHSVTCSG